VTANALDGFEKPAFADFQPGWTGLDGARRQRRHRRTALHGSARRSVLAQAQRLRVQRIDRDDLIVKCGEHSELRLLEVQPEAKRRMSVRDYLNGAHLSPGARFQ